jgi:DNA-binding CsgD family transcriptional regulator
VRHTDGRHLSTPRASSAKEAAQVDEIIDTVRHLVRQAERRLPDGRTCRDLAPHDVLLDTRVDDVRCVMIKVSPESRAAHAHLSPREQEIVRMVAAGHPNKVIAAVLDISCWTVGTYLRRIFAKLGVGSRAAMVARVAGEPEATPAESPSSLPKRA